MAEFPKAFPSLPSQVLATYSFQDLAQNLGYLVMYAAETYNGSAADYILTNSSNFASHDTNHVKTAGAGTIMTNVDFEGLFNTSITIKGTAIINIPVWVTNPNGNNTISVTAVLQHIHSGTTDTLTTKTATSSGQPVDNEHDIISINVDDLDFIINDGDTIRLRLSATLDGTGSPNGYVLHDPLNRILGSSSSSQLKLLLPTIIL